MTRCCLAQFVNKGIISTQGLSALLGIQIVFVICGNFGLIFSYSKLEILAALTPVIILKGKSS